MKPMAAILPMTLLAACQMDQANEAMRGMSEDRMTVARAAFRDMETDDLAGMLLLSKDIADSCDRIEISSQVHNFLSARVERLPFSDPVENRSRLERAVSDFEARHEVYVEDDKAFCAAAKVEMRQMTPLGATLIQGPVS
ncbi:hypothetical protein [Celeribacter halophilus]|uniref:hypothetical protein n=1 Tax=Celeribacter halophilus TaxID=576117 RepID=UPI001C09DFDA|nr:hypothetical protein [Celeribacter halophilus]MBU2889301.1 hypothetical protein [Celeribacter halophilus]MDO6509461.1 hypothetical protein [Celeribacter halophilus]